MSTSFETAIATRLVYVNLDRFFELIFLVQPGPNCVSWDIMFLDDRAHSSSLYARLMLLKKVQLLFDGVAGALHFAVSCGRHKRATDGRHAL
jgi:hypothetical protein